jgi:uncharacterized protein YebE (UPF0316 family)
LRWVLASDQGSKQQEYQAASDSFQHDVDYIVTMSFVLDDLILMSMCEAWLPDPGKGSTLIFGLRRRETLSLVHVHFAAW